MNHLDHTPVPAVSPPPMGRHEERLKSGRVHWQILGNQVFLFQQDAPIALAALPEEDAVNLAARIVAFQHEQVQDPDSKFHGTALIQVKDRHGAERLFIDSNGQPTDHFNRACAESTAMLIAKRATKQSHPPLGRVFLMGHYTDAPAEQQQPHAMPCGHCREELHGRADGASVLYALPHASYSEQSNKWLRVHTLESAQSSDQVAADDVAAMPVRSLLPQRHVRLAGMEWLGHIEQGEHALHALSGTVLAQAIAAVDGGHAMASDSLQSINQALVGAITQCHQATQGSAHVIRAVLVKTSDGKSYVIATPQDEGLPSKPPAVVAALMQAANQRNIADVYVMDYHPAHTEQLRQDAAAGQSLLIPAFDGVELDRVRKHTPKGQQITLHVMPFNDGTLSEQQLKSGINSMAVDVPYPRAYVNPKSLTSGVGLG